MSGIQPNTETCVSFSVTAAAPVHPRYLKHSMVISSDWGEPPAKRSSALRTKQMTSDGFSASARFRVSIRCASPKSDSHVLGHGFCVLQRPENTRLLNDIESLTKIARKGSTFLYSNESLLGLRLSRQDFTIFRFKYQDCLLRMFPRTALKTERYFCCSEVRQVIQ